MALQPVPTRSGVVLPEGFVVARRGLITIPERGQRTSISTYRAAYDRDLVVLWTRSAGGIVTRDIYQGPISALVTMNTEAVRFDRWGGAQVVYAVFWAEEAPVRLQPWEQGYPEFRTFLDALTAASPETLGD